MFEQTKTNLRALKLGATLIRDILKSDEFIVCVNKDWATKGLNFDFYFYWKDGRERAAKLGRAHLGDIPVDDFDPEEGTPHIHVRPKNPADRSPRICVAADEAN